jgi:phosphatidylserine decarboxylase
VIAHEKSMVTREGWGWLIVGLVVWAILFRVWGLAASAPVLVLNLWLFLLFRDPARVVPPLPLAVVAPVDGRIIDICSFHDKDWPGSWVRISIRVNHLGAYTARAPIEGTVHDVREEVEDVGSYGGSTGLWVRSEEDDNVVLMFPGRFSWLAPKAFVGYGERVGQGQRFAYLRLASRAEIYLPETAQIRVSVGDRITAGDGILADLVQNA